MNNVTEYLERSMHAFPDKIFVKDDNESFTYREFYLRAAASGKKISEYTSFRRPVPVFSEKSPSVLMAFFGILYAGCFYTLVDPSFPSDRVAKMLDTLDPDVVICHENEIETLRASGCEKPVITVEELLALPLPTDSEADAYAYSVRDALGDRDPAYCSFTSGSTGVPKGVLISHRSVLSFIDTFTKDFNITCDDVIGNQAPFDFDVSVKDIYSAVSTGATLVTIPKAKFMFPNAVMDMLEENKVTTLIWAVSALCLLSRLHAFKYKVPASIKTIMFSGEVMPVKQLNVWRSFYPHAMFVNLYGPTEITCNCTYYILDREFGEDDKIPAGRAFENSRVILLDENDKEVTKKDTNVPGEICVAGSSVALGYYNNPEATAKFFTKNPLVTGYDEIIYRTGDLAFYGEDGLMYFCGRRDFQIKHMGHRIELEEIESVLNNVDIVDHACCFFDEDRQKIVACYVGSEDKKAIIAEMKKHVPDYMVPNIFRQFDALPLNKNGKTDRKLLKSIYGEKK